MTNIKNLIFLYLLLNCLSAASQDRIYFEKGRTSDWMVTDITSGYIKAVDAKDARQSYSASHRNMLLVFKGDGKFVVAPDFARDEQGADIYIKNFLKSTSNFYHKKDVIFTEGKQMIVCDLDAEKDKRIEYTKDNRKMAILKSGVVLVIYKDGRHKLFADCNKAYKVLKAVQHHYNDMAFSPIKTDSQSNRGAIAPKNDPVVKIDSAIAVIRDDSVVELEPATLASLQQKAITNVRELEAYIKIVCNKESDPDLIQKTIRQAITLFVDEEATFQVSSMNRSSIQEFKVGMYLTRLGLMKYDKVVIEWYNVQYMSRFRKNPDGTYTGNLQFEQRFTGISGDKRLYEDITRKTVQITIRHFNNARDGKVRKEWDVFLGDIGITVTKPA